MRSGRRPAAALAAAVLCVSACSSGGEDPESEREVTVGHLTLEVPEGMTERAPEGDRFDKRFVGEGIEVQVSGAFSDAPDASDARMEIVSIMSQTEDYESKGVEQLDVEGADSSVRSDTSYTDDDGATQQVVWVLAAQRRHSSSAAISISGTDLDEDAVSEIIDSVSFEKTTRSHEEMKEDIAEDE